MSNKIVLTGYAIPEVLQVIPNAPKELFLNGDLTETLSRPRVAIVGSRKVTPYGKAITTQLAGELAGQGVAIISGLAFGVDALAHQAALEAGGITTAVLPTGLDKIYPSSHTGLAKNILDSGGALLTEYPDGTVGHKGNFIRRNRLVSGLSDAVLITEAAEHSGTMHTAAFAIKQGRKLLVVPGNITSSQSVGTNNLIKAGAKLVTSAADILHALGIKFAARDPKKRPSNLDPNEQLILDLLFDGTSDGAELLSRTDMDIQLFSQTLTMLEISGQISSLGNNHWSLL
jgi:DNA processing protein